MALEQKHTQTPWRQFDDGDNATEIMGANGPTVAMTNAELGVRGINEAKANAALIVRAVNNHDALVEALLMARPIVDGIANARNAVIRKQDAEYVVKKIDAALAAAQG